MTREYVGRGTRDEGRGTRDGGAVPLPPRVPSCPAFLALPRPARSSSSLFLVFPRSSSFLVPPRSSSFLVPRPPSFLIRPRNSADPAPSFLVPRTPSSRRQADQRRHFLVPRSSLLLFHVPRSLSARGPRPRRLPCPSFFRDERVPPSHLQSVICDQSRCARVVRTLPSRRARLSHALRRNRLASRQAQCPTSSTTTKRERSDLVSSPSGVEPRPRGASLGAT
jgi:hypothetical protein